MGEDRTGYDGALVLQPVNQLVHVFLGVESQSVHASVELDVYGEVGDSFFLCRLHQCVEQSETVYLRLQIIVEHGLERRHFRVHDHDVARDAVLAQGYALVGYCHGEIVHQVVLQCLGYFHRPGSIRIRFYHAHQFGFRLHEGAVIVEVLHHGTEVYFQYGLVHFLHQEFRELVEAELACALDEDYLVVELAEHVALYKFAAIVEEVLLACLDEACLCLEFRSYADELLHATFNGEV